MKVETAEEMFSHFGFCNFAIAWFGPPERTKLRISPCFGRSLHTLNVRRATDIRESIRVQQVHRKHT